MKRSFTIEEEYGLYRVRSGYNEASGPSAVYAILRLLEPLGDDLVDLGLSNIDDVVESLLGPKSTENPGAVTP